MILNQLVTEFLFKGSTERLEKYNKDLETSKKKLSELKESQKDFNKFFREEEKKLKDEFKNIKASDFVSERTKDLQKQLQDIRSKFSYAKRTTYRRSLERQEREIQESLDKSKASDEAKFLKARKEQQKVLDQTVKNQKKTSESYQEQIDAQKENIETNKEKTKTEKESMNKAGLALGRFTMALGVASAVLATISKAWTKFKDTNAGYLGASLGGSLTTEQLQGVAMTLRKYGITKGKEELTKTLGMADYIASTREAGQNMDAQTLAMAGLDPANAMTVTDLIAGLYASYLAGGKKNQKFITSALASQNLDPAEFENAFKVMKEKGVTPQALMTEFKERKPALTEQENVINLSKTGAWNKFKDEFTGKAGESFSTRGTSNLLLQSTMMNPMLSPIKAIYDMIRLHQSQSGQTGNIYYQPQHTYHIETQSLEGLDGFTDDGLQFKISELNSGGN